MDEREMNPDQTEAAGENQPAQTLAADTLTPEQFEELAAKAAKADDYWQRLLLSAADFENYKKRAAREKQDSISYANEALLQKLIPILDNFEMAIAAAANDGAASKSLHTGVSMIAGQLKNVLAESGLEEINAAGQKFDPNLHEAVSEKATDEVPEGHVAQQIRRGYKFRNRLLRPAGVVVAKQPA
ncbi:MAG TPA: nucleotide exchange factor GrpE [Verrucomicrobiae bacterium]|jgi:molecular chaperone GrpE|nr:nucleotide exchange factor GrpE [Verrucomicrobiae bacterium]